MRRTSVPASALIVTALLSACDQAQPPVAAEVKPVRVAPVTLETTEAAVRYAAVIRPRIEADLGFRVGGKVAERLVEVGSRVEAGVPLARLDPTDLELQVRAVEAQLNAARADEANAKAEFDRYTELRKGEWTTRQEYDRRTTVLERARAKRGEVEANLAVLRNAAEYTTLTADRAGVVTATLVEPGQVVAQGQPAFKVARAGDLEAVFDVPETQSGDFGRRDLAVELWSLPGVSVAGALREMAPSADAATRTYRARVTLKDPPPTVQLGMTATVTARTAMVGEVARVPLAALTQSGSTPAVWVVAGDAVSLRPVTVSAFAGDIALVAGGLAAGERIVTAGVHKLHDGQKVRIWTEPAP